MEEQKKKPTVPTFKIENIKLEEIETLVYQKHDYEKAVHAILSALKRLRVGGEFMGYPINDALRPRLYSRLAAAITAMLLDEKFALSEDGYGILSCEYAVLDALFRSSVFQTTDHLLPMLVENPEVGDISKMKFGNVPNFIKYLLSYSLNSSIQFDFEKAMKKAPQVLLPLYLGWLSSGVVLSPNHHRRREELLKLWPLLLKADMKEYMLPVFSDCYMYSSYTTGKNKHLVKKLYNALSEKLVRKTLKIPDNKGVPEREKPIVLVMIESFGELHAMYRCYAYSIRQLRKKFQVIAVSRPADIEGSEHEFDQVFELPDLPSPEHLFNVVTAVKPDIIYYPSVGMSLYTVLCTNFRLAPLQIMTLGHPATTQSKEIDYVVAEEGIVEEDSPLFSEKLAEIPLGSTRFIMRGDAEFPVGEIDPNKDWVDIAIPAMVCKLNVPFLETLKEIKDKARTPIRYHFFPNMLGLTLFFIKLELSKWFPKDTFVYERLLYNDYLNILKKCDLHFCTFPFGGTNSNIDSLMFGIPTLNLIGPEAHEKFDAFMNIRIGIPELNAQTREEYVKIALDLIHNTQHFRDEMSAKIGPRSRIEAEFFGDRGETHFVDTFWRLHNGLRDSKDH